MILGLILGGVAASVAHHIWWQNQRINNLEQKVNSAPPAAK